VQAIAGNSKLKILNKGGKGHRPGKRRGEEERRAKAQHISICPISSASK